MQVSIESDSVEQELAEFEIISTYFQRPAHHPSIVKTIGDDCALLRVPENCQLAISMDTLVSGRHFPVDATASQIASRAFCTALSDLAAMGAQPRWFTLGLTLPHARREWLADFSQSLFVMADRYQCELIGGDTTEGPLTVTVQVHGFVTDKPLTRSGALVGDTVFVTGTLGDGRAALDILLGQHHCDQSMVDFLTHRFYQPEPQVAAGQLLTGCATAAIDVSDGLLADLGHLAVASQLDIEITTENIPLSVACRHVGGDKALAYALTGGDDYQLVFTVPEAMIAVVTQLIASKQLVATAIGKTVSCHGEKGAVRCYKNACLLTDFDQQGYQHFAS